MAATTTPPMSASAGTMRRISSSGITGHVRWVLVVAQAEVARVAQTVVVGPLAELELGHQLRSHPVRPAEDLGSRWGRVEGAVVGGELVEEVGQAGELGVLEPGADPSGEPQRPAVPGSIVVAHEQGPDAIGAVPFA